MILYRSFTKKCVYLTRQRELRNMESFFTQITLTMAATDDHVDKYNVNDTMLKQYNVRFDKIRIRTYFFPLNVHTYRQLVGAESGAILVLAAKDEI